MLVHSCLGRYSPHFQSLDLGANSQSPKHSSPPTTLHKTNRALEKEGLFSGAILVSRSADVEFHDGPPTTPCRSLTAASPFQIRQLEKEMLTELGKHRHGFEFQGSTSGVEGGLKAPVINKWGEITKIISRVNMFTPVTLRYNLT